MIIYDLAFINYSDWESDQSVESENTVQKLKGNSKVIPKEGANCFEKKILNRNAR